MKRGREYHVGKNITWKMGKGEASNIIFPLILRPLRRKSSGECDILGKKIKTLKNKWVEEEYQVKGNVIHPCIKQG